MKLLSILLAMSLLTVACDQSTIPTGTGTDSSSTPSSSSGDPTPTPTPTPTETPSPTPTPTQIPTPTPTPPPTSSVPEEALTFSTNVKLINFTADQEEKYNKAIEIVKEVIATEEFRDQVLNYTYNGKKQYANNNGLTNEEIYQSILDAAEKLYPTKNNTMDLGVELYYENSTVVGYTYSSSTQIWVNTKYFNQYAPNSVAGNLTHEWLHKLGYGHDSSATSARPHSVPYAIGYIMSDIGKQFL